MSEPPRPLPLTESQIDWQEARRRIQNQLRRKLGTSSAAEIEDLTQEALVRVLRAVRRQGADHPFALMTTVADCTAIDFMRRRQRWSRILEPTSPRTPERPDPRNPSAEVFGDPEVRLQFVVHEFFKTRKSGCSDLAAAFFARHDWRRVASERRESHAAIRKRWERCVEMLRNAVASDPHLTVLAEWSRERR